MNPSRSASCCADASDSQSPSPLARADVAANLTVLATIALRAQGRVFWGGGGSPSWSLLHRYAEKRERGCPRTSSFVIWTSASSMDWMVDVWKSLRMGFRCGEGRNLRSTQHWSHHCTGMALQEEEQLTETKWLLTLRAERKSEPTRSCLVTEVEQDLWCWLPRLGDDETAQFLNALAEARSQSLPVILQERAKAAWLRRWSAMLACSAARAFAVSLLDRRPVPGVGGDPPSVHEVLREDRFLGNSFLCEVSLIASSSAVGKKI